MKFSKALTATVLAVTIAASWPAGRLFAKESEEKDVVIAGREVWVSEDDVRTGFFAGMGPVIGFESNVLLAVGGGMCSQTGYRFNKWISVLLQADIYYTRDKGVDYLFLPILPTVKYHFDNNFFAFLGGGYTWLWASSGPKFNSNASTGSHSFNGWSVLGGGGYDIWISNSIMMSPQVGLDYTRIASSNVVVPNVRVNFNWFF